MPHHRPATARALPVILVAAALLAVTQQASAVTALTTWNLNSDPHEWQDASYWQPAGGPTAYPHDTGSFSYYVFLFQNAQTTVNLQHAIGRLDIASGSTLTVNTTFSGGFTVSDDGTFPSPKFAITNSGTINLAAGAKMNASYINEFSGYETTIKNTGLIELKGTAAAAATLTVKGRIWNTATGVIKLDDASTGANRLFGSQIYGVISQSGTPINPAMTNEGYIHGAGRINGMEIINKAGGVIEADGVNPLILDRGFTQFVPAPLNEGVYKATGAGGLIFGGGTWTSSNGGKIQVLDSQLTIHTQNTKMIGGVVETAGNSTLRLDASSTNIFNLTNTGNLSVTTTNGTPKITGIVTNTGTTTLNTSLTVTGTVNNNAGGTFNIADGKTLTASTVNNHDQFNIGSASSLVIDAGNNYNQDAGQTKLTNGSLTVSGGGAINISGGSVVGSGTLTGPVNVSGTGTIAPGFSPGTLIIDGPFTMDGGVLDLQIGGTGTGDFDQLIINGLASFLGGEVHITFINGFTPDDDDLFPLFTFLGGSTGSPVVTVDGFITEGDGAGGFSFAVPEPTTLALLGLAGVAVMRRRR